MRGAKLECPNTCLNCESLLGAGSHPRVMNSFAPNVRTPTTTTLSENSSTRTSASTVKETKLVDLRKGEKAKERKEGNGERKNTKEKKKRKKSLLPLVDVPPATSSAWPTASPPVRSLPILPEWGSPKPDACAAVRLGK